MTLHYLHWGWLKNFELHDMVENSLIQILNTELDTNFPGMSEEQLLEKISFFIDNLIRNDFQKLVAILYKVDVNENKLKQLLQQREGENAAKIIATLILERQIQKIQTRKTFGGKSQSENDAEEKW